MKYLKSFEAISTRKKSEIIQAAKRGSSNKIKQLLKAGADINERDTYDQKTPLMFAVLKNMLMTVKTLIDEGADVNLQDKDGRTALMMASTNKIIDLLLNADADVNIQDKDGFNVAIVFLARPMNSDEYLLLLKKFLNKGLNLDTKTREGMNLYDCLKTFPSMPEGIPTFLPMLKLPGWLQQKVREIEEFMNENFPKYKIEWEINQGVSKYNI